MLLFILASVGSPFVQWCVLKITCLSLVAAAITPYIPANGINHSQWQNSFTVGFSLTSPRLWQPKNFSRGSWLIRSLRKHLTPGKVKR